MLEYIEKKTEWSQEEHCSINHSTVSFKQENFDLTTKNTKQYLDKIENDVRQIEHPACFYSYSAHCC